jgi:hypothetical protein
MEESDLSLQTLPASFQKENPNVGDIHSKPETVHWTKAPG